jgi:colanic acid/amylovoran biosynthesis glycosyltransferase
MGKLEIEMRILAYTENYASETVTFITNELKAVEQSNDLLLLYSVRKNKDRYALKNMVQVPYRFNRVVKKLRWWSEQWQWNYFLRNTKFALSLNKNINEFQPQIIHCHFGTDYLKLAANLDPQNANIPTLVSFYGFDVTERIQNKAVLKSYQTYLNKTNVHSVAVSLSLTDKINTLIRPANNARVLHSGIDTELYKRKALKMEAGEFVFVQVASFNPKKGHKYTLQAFRKFIDSNTKFNYKFIIAGFGPLEEEIKQQVKALGLEDKVSVLGPVDPNGMVDLCSRANCFVHMSVKADNGDEEGLPNVLLEAMSLELPVMATWHAGIPEIVEDGVNGLLCEEKNIDQYVKAFAQISDWEIKPGNRKKIEEKFSLDAHMKKLQAHYLEIVKN